MLSLVFMFVFGAAVGALLLVLRSLAVYRRKEQAEGPEAESLRTAINRAIFFARSVEESRFLMFVRDVIGVGKAGEGAELIRELGGYGEDDFPRIERWDDIKHDASLYLFPHCWNRLAREVNGVAREKGWWDSDRSDGEIVALMHSELSEALEGLRKGNPDDEHVPGYPSVAVELADTVIRIMDFSVARGHDVAGAIFAKKEFNKTRPRKHGGKRF